MIHESRSDMEAAPKVDLLATALSNLRLLFIVGCVGAVIAVTGSATIDRQYQASARMLVDPRDLVILGEQVTPNTEDDSLGVTVVQSQALVFTSRVVLNSVIDRLKLDENPDFNGEGSGGFFSIFASASTTDLTPEEAAQDVRIRRSAALAALEDRIVVKRISSSFVLEIGATAGNPPLAQAIVEAVVASYLQDLLRSRAEIARRASEDLTAGLQQTRDKLHSIERDIATYIAAHDLFETREELLLNERLASLTGELEKARVESARVKAQLDQSAEDLASLNSLPEALNSQSIGNLRAAQAQIIVERARQAMSFSASTSTMRALTEQETAIEDLIKTELTRIQDGLSVQYARALQHERDLEAKVEEVRTELEEAHLAQIQLRELNRELEAYRTIYNAALTRARQAREQSRVNTANVRVISPATAQEEPVYPPPMTLLAGFGFVISAMVTYVLLHIRALAGARRL